METEFGNPISYGVALDHLRRFPECGITRIDWHGSQAKPTVRLQTPDENSFMTEPYLYMEKFAANGKTIRFPVDLSAESVLSDNWIVVD